MKRKPPDNPPPPDLPEEPVQAQLSHALRPAEFFPDADIWKGSTVYPNTAQVVIVTTEDKVRNYLHDYSRAINVRTKWIAPFSLFFAVGGTILTVSFTDKFGSSADFWRAIFWIGWFLSGVWLAVETVKIPFQWKKGDTERLINKLKNLE